MTKAVLARGQRRPGWAIIGVLFIPIFRRYFLDDPEMVFADGVAAAETTQVLDAQAGETQKKLRLLGVCGVLSGITSFAVNGFNFLPPLYIVKRFQIGLEWSLLSFGIGLQIGPRISLSIGLGTLIMLLAGPTILARDGREIINSTVAAVGGMLPGSGIAALLAAALSKGALDAWGWRVAFLLGGLIGVVA